jgi:hypothetical protein
VVPPQLNSLMCVACNEGRDCPACFLSTQTALLGPGLGPALCRLLLLACCTVVLIQGQPMLREQEHASEVVDAEPHVDHPAPAARRGVLSPP